jgi:hypothetical protein
MTATCGAITASGTPCKRKSGPDGHCWQHGNGKQPVGELIGRTSYVTRTDALYPSQGSVDWTVPDYKFWDRLRRGKQDNYRIGGLFASPIGRIMSAWVLGDNLKIIDGDNETVNAALADFVKDNKTKLSSWNYDGYTLGDGYTVVNPDGTLTHISPDQVYIETNPLDYREVVSYTITTVINTPINFVRDLMNPNFGQMMVDGRSDVTITDRYYADKRIVTVKRGYDEETQEYANPTGLFPVIHFPNQRDANAVQGHPIVEKLLYLFSRYDNVINKALDAVELMGNPIPVAEGLEDPLQSQKANETSTETVHLADGTTESRSVIDFDRLTMLWLGKGANFKFAAPGSFTGDSGRMLEFLFLIMLQVTLIPEHVWGGAISSSKASVDAQLPSFAKAVGYWRQCFEPFLLQLAQTWLAWRALVDPSLTVKNELSIEWDDIIPMDEKLTILKVRQAVLDGLLTDETELRILDLVDNPADEVENASMQAQEKQAAFNDRVDKELDNIERSNGRQQAPSVQPLATG